MWHSWLAVHKGEQRDNIGADRQSRQKAPNPAQYMQMQAAGIRSLWDVEQVMVLFKVRR